jgi:hypothetical protein
MDIDKGGQICHKTSMAKTSIEDVVVTFLNLCSGEASSEKQP